MQIFNPIAFENPLQGAKIYYLKVPMTQINLEGHWLNGKLCYVISENEFSLTVHTVSAPGKQFWRLTLPFENFQMPEINQNESSTT
jgi:hypothetical protein